MGGLGEQGKDKLKQLFSPTTLQDDKRTSLPTKSKKTLCIRKGYVIPFELSERLRAYTYKTRQKEISVVIAALEQFLAQK